MRKILYVKQTDLRDCGVSCLMALVKYYGGCVSREYLREITKTTEEGVSAYSLIQAGEKLGFEAKAVESDIRNLKNNLPLIAHLTIDKKYGHFVVVTKISNNNITIMDPDGGYKQIDYEKWNDLSTRVYLLYVPKSNILKQGKEKNFIEIIIPIIKKYKMTFIILCLLSIVYTISNILISYQFQFFLELLIPKNFSAVNLIFYFLILIIFLKEITNLFRNHLVNYINHVIDKTLLSEVYNHIIRLPYLYFKNRTKGDIITRIQDVFTIREVISQLFVTVAIDLILVVVVFIFLVKINLKLSLISLLISLVYIFIIFTYNTLISRKLKKLKEKESVVNNHLIESLSSINTIKSMQIEDMLSSNLKEKYFSYQDTSFSLYKNYYHENFFKDIVYSIGILIITYLGIKGVLEDTFTLGKLLVFHSLVNYYFTQVQNMCNLQLIIKEASVSFTRIKELLNLERENLQIDNKYLNQRVKGNISITHLKYSYNGIRNTLKCENLNIKHGEKVLLYGTSGGGKSTLMKIMCAYIKDYEGKIQIDDKELYNYNLLDLRKRITYISQDEIIFTDTIYNNIVLNNDVSYDKYLEIINLTGVNKIIERSFLKDNMLLENSGSNLSGGEKQRILLARALVKRSDIYIFDEAFSALDMKNERKVLKNIFDYLKEKTVIVISHRFNNRDLYQKFILIEKGIVYEC